MLALTLRLLLVSRTWNTGNNSEWLREQRIIALTAEAILTLKNFPLADCQMKMYCSYFKISL